LAPAGNWCDEYKFRRNQANELSLRLAGSSIAKRTARLGYKTMVCTALEFPLGVTQFSQKQCDTITSPVLRTCLSKMGYNRNTPKEVVYGPTEMGGIAMHDLFIEQGIQHVIALVGHLRQDSKTGKMMKIELDWCHLQAGTALHLLEHPESSIDYTEDCWIMAIRDFLRMYKLHLEFSAHSQPVILCDQDEFIMDAFRVRGGCTSKEMQRLNACRMHLKVFRVSEISCADGRSLRPDVLKGLDSAIHLSDSRWPRQARPLSKDWKLWSKTLRSVFSSDGKINRLRHPLGEWHSTAAVLEWPTLFSPHSLEAYSRLPDDTYQVHPASLRRQGRHSFVDVSSNQVIDFPPPDVVPADLIGSSKTRLEEKSHVPAPGLTASCPFAAVELFRLRGDSTRPYPTSPARLRSV
jgi:hypothetical protein